MLWTSCGGPFHLPVEIVGKGPRIHMLVSVIEKSLPEWSGRNSPLLGGEHGEHGWGGKLGFKLP